jgi:hypothetical protein
MSTPLAALNRITVPYTVSGHTHKLRFYVIDHGTITIDGFRTIETRTSFMGWSAAIQAFCEKFASVALGTATVIGTCLYEEFDDPLWLPMQTYAPTGLSYGTQAAKLAGQLTITLRSGVFKPIKVVIMESTYAVPIKSPVPPDDGFLGIWTVAYGASDDPINWQVGRDNTFMQEAPYAGYSTDYNRKLRRMRGI